MTKALILFVNPISYLFVCSLFLIGALSITHTAFAEAAFAVAVFSKDLVAEIASEDAVIKQAFDHEPRVMIETSLGNIGIVLYTDKAPLTVENFLGHVDAERYQNLIFHRVIEDFMIQSGGYRKDLQESESDTTVRNEADNGLRNLIGTISMARGDEIDSASQQFFINTQDNRRLDHNENSCTREDEAVYLKALERGLNKPRTCATFGYAVFGHVVSGMDVVRAIEITPTEDREDFYDLPIDVITIKSVRRISSELSGNK